MNRTARISLWLFALLALAALGHLLLHITPSQTTLMNNEPVTIWLGESTESFNARLGDQVYIDRQPAGVDFPKIHWPSTARGHVRIEHGAHSFDIRHVRSVMGMEDQSFKDEGIVSLSVRAGTGFNGPTPHRDAHIIFYNIIQTIKQAGWRQYIEYSIPRLSGKSLFEYTTNGERLDGLDANYVPTPDEWLKIKPRTPFMFYANGAFLRVIFDCWEDEKEPDKAGTYLFSFNIKTDVDYFRQYVSSEEDRADWRGKVEIEIEKALVTRQQREAELRARGIEIDETYQDPPLPEP